MRGDETRQDETREAVAGATGAWAEAAKAAPAVAPAVTAGTTAVVEPGIERAPGTRAVETERRVSLPRLETNLALIGFGIPKLSLRDPQLIRG